MSLLFICVTKPVWAECLADYHLVSEWSDGFTAKVTLTNQGKAFKNWQVTWAMPNNQQITTLWQGILSQSGNKVVVDNESYNGDVAKNAQFDFGFNASYQTTNDIPKKIYLNGELCKRPKTPRPTLSCSASYVISGQSDSAFTGTVTVKNSGSDLQGWQISWKMPGNQTINNLWNGVVQQSGNAVTVGNASWNRLIASDATIELGFSANYSGTNAPPKAVFLNGVACAKTSSGDDGNPNTGNAPKAPSGLAATVLDNAQVVLTWRDNSSNEKSFKIERRLSGRSSWQALTNTAKNISRYQDASVDMGNAYEYRVTAVNDNGASSAVAASATLLSLVEYGAEQYKSQGCAACHGSDGSGGTFNSPLTGFTVAELKKVETTIKKTMPLTSPGSCTGNCATGIAHYLIEVLALVGNNECSKTKPPHPRSLRLLTRQEYQNTVNDLLGLSVSLVNELPQENRVDGFDNNVDTNQITGLRLEAFLQQAEKLANQAVNNNWAKLVSCNPQEANCATQFVTRFGKRAYRRPLTQAEINAYLDLFTSTNLKPAVTDVITRMLMSPHFLYRSELGQLQKNGSYQLTAYEIASSLSYLFLGTLPDAQLLKAADNNQLATAEQRLTQAKRLLALPQSKAQLGQFVGQWLLSTSPYSLPNKDLAVYPNYSSKVKTAMSQEMINFFLIMSRFDSSQRFAELFTADYVIANKTLADYYGLKGPIGADFEMTPVANNTRFGLLTLGAVLARYANSNESHPFKRGGFLHKRLLCHDLPLPANMGFIVAPKPDPNATTKERFNIHSASNTSCYNCHQFLDDPGFGFEHYDGAGQYRAKENGRAIETAGILRGLETFKADEAVNFTDLADLSNLLSTSSSAAQCVATQYYRFAQGRRENTDNICSMKSYLKTYTKSGNNLQTMLQALVTSPSFILRR
ncbi:cellulose binding domain-containing protein [Methylocucumis oryzae]|uniref:cellulose binding domain-containing protein n=1 Tax=Methylocucumis oryzae TaxID=1632867 RepID=UPI0006986CB3|nr:cellulose binding domain-containing protein [Methylocucumis oryzae]